MDILTLAAVVMVAAILVGGWLMTKEMTNKHHLALVDAESKMPPKPPPPPFVPPPPISDVQAAINALEVQLDRLQDEYAENGDSDVLTEISKINATLGKIATTPSGNICKCGLKKS